MDTSTIESLVRIASNYGLSIVLAIILIIILIRDKNMYQKIVTDVARSVEDRLPKHPDTEEYTKYDKSYATLQAVLDKTRVAMNAARISVVMYHNGGQNLVGIPFQKMSIVSESVAPGIARAINDFQSVQRGSYVVLHQKLNSDHYWMVPDVSSLDKTLITHSTLSSHSSAAACFVRVTDLLNDLPIGFICIEYMRTLADSEQDDILKQALDLSESASAIMGVKNQNSPE